MHTTDPHHLAHEPASVGVARRLLRRDLEALGVAGEVVDDAVLVLSELVSNAVEHGRPDGEGAIRVSWQVLDDRVVLDVRDSGTGTLVARITDETDLRGRGLVIVESVCSRWRIEHDDGTHVRAELALAG